MTTFVPASPRSIRVKCGTCGARGFPGGSWQAPHRRGHKPCPHCGRQLPVKLDGGARVHTRCPRGGGA
jgi:endogenous inhibitor of DNA gyrase (YacG/DUF329 family)